MARDLLDLAASAKRTADALPEAQMRGVRKAALHTTNLIRSEIRSATGGDMRMSGLNRGRGGKVGARFDIKGSTNPTALITATGPLHLLERDTSPHPIFARGSIRRRRARRGYAPNAREQFLSGARALKVGQGFATWVWHPGTRGKHPFERGWKRAAPDTPRILQTEVRAAVVKGWGL